MILKNYNIIIFDFDGVIKQSAGIKTAAYKKVFRTANTKINQKILNHHKKYQGVSRFVKIPIYANWAGFQKTKKHLKILCEFYQKYVFQKVINCPEVVGERNYLAKNYKVQRFYLASATPHLELNKIAKKIKVKKYFKRIFGSPNNKKLIIKNILNQNQSIPKNKVLFIGDSIEDFKAAMSCKISFLFRGSLKDYRNYNNLHKFHVKRIEKFE